MNIGLHGDRPHWLEAAISITAIIMPLVWTSIGWLSSQVIANSRDMSAMQASAFTTSDAMIAERRVHAEIASLSATHNQELASIREILHRIDKKVPDEVPPDWFTARVTEMELRLERLFANGPTQ